jgi:hypothetical protein
MVGCIWPCLPSRQAGQAGCCGEEAERARPPARLWAAPGPPNGVVSGRLAEQEARCSGGAQAVRSMRVRQNSLRVWATLLSGA